MSAVTQSAVIEAFWRGDTDQRTWAPCAPPYADCGSTSDVLAAVYVEGWDFAEAHAVPELTLRLLRRQPVTASTDTDAAGGSHSARHGEAD